ncbi:MAG TPA: hypothetical protein VNT01_07225 [Symbiobacteriaceae bacterium]|nr:hypothetical protein [Symbiobacteriaceae bacterium]
MKKAWPWFIAIVLGYVLLIGVVLYLVPMPWNLVISAVVLLMAVRFAFTIRKVSQLGARRSAPK